MVKLKIKLGKSGFMERSITIVPHWSPSFKIVSSYVGKALRERSYNTHVIESTRYFSYITDIIRKSFHSGIIIFIGNFRDYLWFLKYLISARAFSQRIIFYGVVEGPLRKDHGSYLFYSLIDDIIVASRYGASRLKELGVKPTAVVPHAIDVYEFERVCSNIRGKQDDKVVLFTPISALVPRKGLSIYLKALGQVLNERPDLVERIKVILKVPEPIEVPSELKRMVNVISGWLDRASVIQLYCNSDVVVIPSLNEGFSLPIIESFAAGKPVISLDAPPMNELNSNEYGWLVKVRRSKIVGDHECFIPDIDDFVGKIIDAVEDNEKRILYSKKVSEIRWKYHYQFTYKIFDYLIIDKNML
jgi:glycosyltransferase involved in cell wall biosynthesis